MTDYGASDLAAALARMSACSTARITPAPDGFVIEADEDGDLPGRTLRYHVTVDERHKSISIRRLRCHRDAIGDTVEIEVDDLPSEVEDALLVTARRRGFHIVGRWEAKVSYALAIFLAACSIVWAIDQLVTWLALF